MRVVSVSESMLCELIGLPDTARIIGAEFRGGITPRESTLQLLVSGDDEPASVRGLRGIVIEPTETGYSAYAPSVPGCVAAGATREETETLMREALALATPQRSK